MGRQHYGRQHDGDIEMEASTKVDESKRKPRELTIDELKNASGGFSLNIPAGWIFATLICRK
jgi:hypothetical protein